MSRFQSHFKRALMFCVLAPAFTQYPCLAQSSNETAANQLVLQRVTSASNF